MESRKSRYNSNVTPVTSKNWVGVPKQEATLVRTLVRCLHKGSWGINHGSHNVTVTELDAGQGCPDVLHAGYTLRSRRSVRAAAHVLRLPSASQLLSKLRVRRSDDVSGLKKTTGLSEKVIRVQLASLSKLGIAQKTRTGRYRLSPDYRVPRVEIWAFEAKTHDWRRALYQALQYRGFAHRIYVLMPVDRARLLRRQAKVFRQFGIGVLLVTSQELLRCVVAAKPQTPRSRAMHLQLASTILATVRARSNSNRRAK